MNEFSSGQRLIWVKDDGSKEDVTFVGYEMCVCVVRTAGGALHMVPSVNLVDPEVDKREQMYTSDISHLLVHATDAEGKLVRVLKVCGTTAYIVYPDGNDESVFQCSLNSLHAPCPVSEIRTEPAESAEPSTEQAADTEIATIQSVTELLDAYLYDERAGTIYKCKGAEFLSMHKKKKQWFFIVFSPEGTKQYYTQKQLFANFKVIKHR